VQATMNSSSEPESSQESKVDSLDLAIIKLLQNDGRVPYSYIAKTLNIPEATARYRVKKMIDDEIISINAFVNFEKLSARNVICVEVEVYAEFFENTLQKLIEMENVNFISATTGEFNILLDYVYENNEDLLGFLLWLKKQQDVIRIESRTFLKVYKSQYPIRIEGRE
jgi:Lrp/AsnC family transcriptional regulator, regulator for asnA, asnC and gidA